MSQSDLFHPLASLNWEKCHIWKNSPIHCAVLKDTVVILKDDTLHIFSTDLHCWSTKITSYHGSSLTTFKSKFVLVGGRLPTAHMLTNQLWTSTTGLVWEKSLPAMPTSRYATSSVSGGSPEVLVVAGGLGMHSLILNVVEVLNGNHWNTAAILPTPCYRMRSAFHKGNFYFTDGRPRQRSILYTCDYDSLMNRTTTGPVWRETITPDATRAIASYSSRLIRINYNSIITSYSDSGQKWVELTSVGDVPQHPYGTYACIAILSTGQLMIAYEYAVYKITLSVSSFDPDTRFMPNVLARLEAVMGVQIMSVLADLREEFTTILGMKKKMIKKSSSDRILEIMLESEPTYPVRYIVEAMILWCNGHSPRHPTWRELLQVFQKLGLLELQQQIESFMKGEASYLEMYHHFIATKESLDMLFLKFLFVGPPRLGKTTLRRRFLKEIVDLLSAGEADHSQPSTGTVASSDVVVSSVSSTTAVITESEWSALESLGDEARVLIHSLMATVRNGKASSTAPFQANDVSLQDQSETYESSQPSLTTTNESGQESSVPPVPSSVTSSTTQSVGWPQNIPESSTILRKAMGSEHWNQVRHIFKAFLRMEDTGGQPELMDMLPALTLGPGLYLLFINLQNDLNHHYKLTYCNASGENTPVLQSVYSVKEMLLSCLSSISCSNANAPVSKLTTSSPYVENMLESSKPIAHIVGTHKDKVSSEHIKKINEDLKKVIKPTQFYKNDIVQFASDEDLIIAVDNMAGGAEEVQMVKKLLEDAMARHFKKLRVPAVWLFFSLYLRHCDKRTTTLEYCMKLSSTLGMPAQETETALWFLHHHAGVLMYFPNVLELKDLVIIDVQVVYDSVTALILQAMSFDKVGHSDAEEFKKTGKFTMSRIISVTKEVSGDHIPIDKLVALLEFLHIIARISSDQSPQLSSFKEDVTYMMPCVLRNATTDKLDSLSFKEQKVPSLLFHFICGSVPIGLFPALISCLIANKSFKLIHEDIHKNFVKFRYGRWRSLVAFSSYSTFYQLSVSTCTKDVLLHEECDSIRKEIESTFPKVTSRFNYGSLVDYQLAFYCPIHPTSKRHLCVVNKDEDLPQMMDCLENSDPVRISEHHKIWFIQSPQQASSAAPEQEEPLSSCTDKDKPTLRSLIAFRCSGDESINILNEIGADYHDFGILLLSDDNGKTMKRLIQNHSKDALPILRNIFELWLDGRGQPVSWQTLVDVLKDTGLIALAKKIQSQKML